MFVGKADTLSTLESTWTSVAFPEEFVHKRVQQVPTRRLSGLLRELGFHQIGFLKIGTEGHDYKVLAGLFDDASNIARPAVIMFEANQRFPQQAIECLRILRANGYKSFDIFIKTGNELLAATRFNGEALPAEWRAYEQKYFYANIIAYASGHLASAGQPTLTATLQQDHLKSARTVLRAALTVEKRHGVTVHKEWVKAREQLRDYILNQNLDSFLQHSMCRRMFFRTGWGPAQEYELHYIGASEFGRRLLREVADPSVGQPEMSPCLPKLSANMLGMMYYLLRVKRWYENELPRRVIEVGGGYGAFSYLFCLQNPT